MIAGMVMQFLWTDWRPQYENKELLAHTGLYYSGGLNTNFNPKEPQARDDDYLLLLGFHLLLEHSSVVQRIFQNPFFVYLGRRSMSKPLLPQLLVPTLLPRLTRSHDTNALLSRLVPRSKYHHLHCWHQTLHVLDHAERFLCRSRKIGLPRCLCGGGIAGR